MQNTLTMSRFYTFWFGVLVFLWVLFIGLIMLDDIVKQDEAGFDPFTILQIPEVPAPLLPTPTSQRTRAPPSFRCRPPAIPPLGRAAVRGGSDEADTAGRGTGCG